MPPRILTRAPVIHGPPCGLSPPCLPVFFSGLCRDSPLRVSSVPVPRRQTRPAFPVRGFTDINNVLLFLVFSAQDITQGKSAFKCTFKICRYFSNVCFTEDNSKSYLHSFKGYIEWPKHTCLIMFRPREVVPYNFRNDVLKNKLSFYNNLMIS